MSKYSHALSEELAKLQVEMRNHAVEAGLDFFEVIFEECDPFLNILYFG